MWKFEGLYRVVLEGIEGLEEEDWRNVLDVLLSLESEYILSTRLGGQDAS